MHIKTKSLTWNDNIFQSWSIYFIWGKQMIKGPCSSHSDFNQLSAWRQNNTTQYAPCLLQPHLHFYGHQLPSFIALAQEHTAIRAVPQLLQSGVAVHRPETALPHFHRGALTVQQMVIVNTSYFSTDLTALYAALSSWLLKCRNRTQTWGFILYLIPEDW